MLALELVRKDMKVADEPPFVAGVDDVQATVLLGRGREGESYRDDGGRVQEARISVVLVRLDRSISRWRLQQKNILEQMDRGSADQVTGELGDAFVEVT